MSRLSLMIIAVLAVLNVFGCTTTPLVYLQSATIEGPLTVPPLFVTENENEQVGSFRLKVGASAAPAQKIEGRADGHSKVNAAGVFEVDTVIRNGERYLIERPGANTHTFEGTNFRWTLAPLTVSIEADFLIARGMSLVGGLHCSKQASQTYLAGTLGVGSGFRSRNLGFRFDVGAAWTSVSHKVEYILAAERGPLLGPRETYILFLESQGTSGHMNVYGGFTLNTRYPNWPIQVFVQLAIYRQTVDDLQRRTSFGDAVVLQSNSFFTVTPGISIPLSPNAKLLLGLRLTDETSLIVGEPGMLLAPFAHVAFEL